jgi:hypothetical protein
MKKILQFSLLLAVLIPVAVAAEEGKSKRESYAGVIVGTGGRIGGQTLNLDIHIDKYTSDQEVQEYLVLLKESGQDELRKTLEKVSVGRIAPVGRTGTDLSIARVHQTEEGKVIRLVTPRPVSFFEAYRSGRSMDYPFTIMEIRLNKEGKGEGSIMGGAQLRFDKDGQLNIESYGNYQYAKVINVRSWD